MKLQRRYLILDVGYPTSEIEYQISSLQLIGFFVAPSFPWLKPQRPRQLIQ